MLLSRGGGTAWWPCPPPPGGKGPPSLVRMKPKFREKHMVRVAEGLPGFESLLQ